MRRDALLAGRWYPDDPAACRAEIERHGQGDVPDAAGRRGLIGPHAGWAFSGGPAARAYRALARAQPDADLIVVFGAHRGPDGPNTIFRDAAWDTPLGPLRTAQPLADELAQALDLEAEPARPLRADNAVELHLPFVKHHWPDASLIVIGVAASEVALDIGREVGRRVSDRNAVVIGSTDLTHYGPNYGFAPKGRGEAAVRWVREVNDRGYLDAVCADDAAGSLAHARARKSACCPGAVSAAMECVKALGTRGSPELIAHTLSYDVRPDDSFVGYAALLL